MSYDCLLSRVSISINGITLKLAGTAFVTGDSASGKLALTMLDGVAGLMVDSASQIVPAGAQSSTTGSSDPLTKAAPYDATLTDGLAPILNTLPRIFQVTPPQTQNVIDAQIAALTQPQPTPFPTATISANECRLTVGRTTSTWSGPGQDYEIVATLAAGTTVHPVEASTDTLGAVWWELDDSQWIPKIIVVERGGCSALNAPIVGKINAPPTNRDSLERCQSSNGPVRAGQQVTFEFVPPPWNSLGEAQAALQTDPGHFIINAQRYRANVSQPIRLGENVNPLEDRYLRRFSMVWTAQPGTYRVTGDWLSYSPSCNLTVSVEQ